MMEQSVNPVLSVRPLMGVDRGTKSSPAGWAHPVLGDGATRAETLTWPPRRCAESTRLSIYYTRQPYSICYYLHVKQDHKGKRAVCLASCGARSRVKSASSSPILTSDYSSSTHCLPEWQLQRQREWGQLHRAAPSGLPGPSHLLHALLLLALGHRCLLLLSQGKDPETSSLSLTLITLHSI